ncbi:OLC1v1023047C1 [Oldenlandia corymbosa var. corymbosa]|uniref:Dynein light chain 1, cytoplasmic n=1 Tax=Oldenlandia corymbosa var. corymbosa TaxID=529605 RepID=A0AAV1BZE1_OLDCO|nr:OLC1v1023047C1 [Oldenlandia corymbosa var. corymbosa]
MMEMTTGKNCNCKDETHHHHHQKIRADMQKSSNGFSRSRIQERQLASVPETLAARFEQSVNISKKNTPPSEQELKLAAMAINLNVRLRISDMPITMQEHALRFARLLVGATAPATAAAAPPPPQRLSSTLLARSLKREFDGRYGPAWHCVVGKSFGSFVTHSAGGFVYFSLDSLSFLLFKTEVQLVKDSPLERA